jgi:hypothetical protein
MRQKIKDFVGICAEHLKLQGPVYECGSLQVPGQEGFADLRPYFPGKEYVGLDMRHGPGVDKIVDLHLLGYRLAGRPVGTMLCMDTLEHVRDPWLAMREMASVMQPGGVLIISSHMLAPIHDFPSDYWRFTPSCFEMMLAECFESSWATWAGRESFPHTVVGIGFKGPLYTPPAFVAAIRRWKRWQDLLSGPFPGGLPW